MRISSVWLTFLIAGCHAPLGDDPTGLTGALDTVECALGGATTFAKTCAIEPGDGSAVTLRHRDGGFRRLTRQDDGVMGTADGAETVDVVMLDDGRAELSIGEDRYRLPATL